MTSQMQVKTREATLSHLLKDGESSASRLASVMRISVQAMRRHLRNLEQEGLIESNSISLGPGRPSNLWHLTSLGHNYFNSGKGGEQFALELLHLLESTLSKNKTDQILRDLAVQKANVYRRIIGSGAIQTRLKKLIELRMKEGYISDFHLCSENNSSWYLNAFSCSIRGIAERFPIVCDQELQLIRYIFPDCNVERVQWIITTGHTCGFKITPNS